MEYESIITIYNNDMEQMERLLNMFEGDYTLEVFENTIEFEKSNMEKYNEERKNNSHASKFITLCGDIMKLKHIEMQQQKKNRKGELITVEGVYKKKTISEHLNIHKKQIMTQLFNDKDVIDYIARHNIIVGGQSLDFTQYV